MQRAAIDNQYPSLDKYILVKTLFSSYNCKVKLGFNTTSIKNYIAVKIFNHSHPNFKFDVALEEAKTLASLDHPHIIKLIEYHESTDYVKKNGETYKAFAIVMEYLPRGELFEQIAQSGTLSEDTARAYFKILLETVDFCHQKGITHRDLKLECLVFDDDLNFKIVGFGSSTLIAGKDGDSKLHTMLGTKGYMAPELFVRHPYSGVSVDLFACGVILFIMISGNPPFTSADPRVDPHYKLFVINKQEIFWQAHERNKPRREGQETFYSTEFKKLMTSMLALHPEERLSVEEIKAHPWVQG